MCKKAYSVSVDARGSIKIPKEWVMSLTEILYFDKSASIAFDRINALWAKPKPLYKQKEQTHRIKSCMSALFLLVLV